MRLPCCLLLAACSFEHGKRGNGGLLEEAGVVDVANDPDSLAKALRQKTITISSAAVVGSHTDFPLWVMLPTDAELAARARSDGADIHFVSGTTPLAYELQRWSKAEGRLEAWVRVPTLAAGTTILLRYGDVTAAHAANSAGTFSGYSAVWHFDDRLETDTIADALGTTNGTAAGLGSSDSVPGQLGRGIDFNDNAERIAFTNPLTGNMPHTISAWVNQVATTSNDAIIALGPGGTNNQARWFHSRFNSAEIAVGFYGNDWTSVNYNIIDDGWVLLHWVYEGNRMSRMYVNGAQVAGPFQHNANINTQGTEGMIGNAPASFGSEMGINATLDEVRIINVARGATWIAAEAVNQSASASMYTIGPEQVP